MRKFGIVLIGIICLFAICGCKQYILIESNEGVEKAPCLEQEEQDTGLIDNDVNQEKDMQTKENYVYTSNVYGVWEIIEYIGRGIDSHAADIYEENMQNDCGVYQEERELLVGQRIEIEPDGLEYCLPSGEREGERFVNSYEEMFFGYKPPIEMEVKYPVERFYIEWKEDKTSVYIILDSEGTAVVDINGDFYYMKHIESETNPKEQ